jgi:diguanylate cyclase (GGDEF)-like protein/PAS domain S-box-containing protein
MLRTVPELCRYGLSRLVLGHVPVDDLEVTGPGSGMVSSELSRFAHWDGLIAELATAVIVTDATGRIVIWNRAATELYGWQPAEARGRDVLPLLLDTEAELRAVAAIDTAATGRQWAGDLECRHRNGSRIPVHLTMSAVYDDDRAVVGFVSESRELSDLKAAESHSNEMVRELRAADARQQAIVARSRDATLFFDSDGTIRWASPVSSDLIGIGPGVLLGMNGLDFIHPDDQERVLAEFLTMSGLGDHVRTEFRIIDPKGELHWVEEDATNLVDDPDVGYVVANIRDITVRKRAQEQLERLSLHDPLTGLPNRSLLVNRLEALLARGSAAAILDIDIDNFGDVNDSLGHAAGDELLQLIGSRFATAVVQSPSTLARVGADEFVLLCDDVGDATTAFSYAERLRESLKDPVQLAGQEVIVTASIGVALGPGDATGLMRDARMATHQAKQQGRDRVIVFDQGLDVTQQRRLAVQRELRHALANDELVVWYQPIVDLHTSRVAGVEALVRWDHPEHGLLGPEYFIDVAETSGLISALGSQVLRKACADAGKWQKLGRRFRISVNAAAAQLSNREYAAEIDAALKEFELEPGQVTIELTETAAMQIADSLENLHGIRALGVHLSLDDFGTGYSSLSFLRELPVDAIKIDRSFVDGLGTNPRDASIVQGVIAMADALGYDVVAEGVETTAQVEALRRLGCRYAQGFLWSRPAPAADIPDIARRIQGIFVNPEISTR